MKVSTAGRNERSGRGDGGRSRTARRRTPTRSFACPDELWAEILRFGARHRLQPSDALRTLLADGLRASRVTEELEEARAWQIAQAWAEAERIAAGDRSGVGWEAIEKRFEQARWRIREREAERTAAARH